jgi:hypothetical protein
VTNGNAAVTGTGTTWVSGPTDTVYLGTSPDFFKVDNDGAYYKIIAVGGDGALTLEKPYEGTTGAGLRYSIIMSRSGDGTVRNWLTNTTTNQGIVPATVTDTDATGYTTGKYNLGAAFNLNLLEHDPGAYVHNRIYAKRLLYDSIDWADDNLMNYSVGNTLDTLVPVGAVFRVGAMKYLLPYGVLGIAAERP